MADTTILIKRSGISGSIPQSGSLQIGELALNTTDGGVFYHDTGSDSVELIRAGTSSYALNAGGSGPSVSASYALTASYAENAGAGAFDGTILDRDSVILNTGNLTSASAEVGIVPLGKVFNLLNVSTSRDSRIRLYTTPAFRDADLSREPGTDPTGEHGVIVDLVLTGSFHDWQLSPLVLGASLESPVSAAIAYTIQNRTVTEDSVSVDFTRVKIENWETLQGTGSLHPSGAYGGDFSGSFSGSVTGTLVGLADSASYAFTSSWAETASYAPSSGGSGVFGGDFSGSFSGSTTGTLVGLADSASWAETASYAENASGGLGVFGGDFSGSFSGSMSGTLVGLADSASVATSASYAPGSPSISSSYATTASFATSASWAPGSSESASYALTSSFATTASYTEGSIESASVATTASYAETSSFFSGSLILEDGLIVTGSVTASVGFQGTGSGIVGVVSSSYATSASWAPGSSVSASFATTASFAATASLLLGVIESASFALTSSYTDGSIATASYADFAIQADSASYISGSSYVNFPNGLIVTGSVTASVGFEGTGSGIVGVVSSSYAETSSFALNLNKEEHFTIYSSDPARTVMTSQTESLYEYGTDYRKRMVLDNYTQARISTIVHDVGYATSSLAVQYSTNDGVDWDFIDGLGAPSLSLASTGNIAGEWISMVSESKSDVVLRWVSQGGNAVASPSIGSIILVVR